MLFVSERRNDDHPKKRINKIQDHRSQNRKCSKDCIKPRSKNVIEIKMDIWHESKSSKQNYRLGGLYRTGSKNILSSIKESKP